MDCKEQITQEEKNCILFYQGAADRIQLGSIDKHLRVFYNISNAYEVINTLLFPGISNEKVRIGEEDRHLSPVLLDYMSELIKVYCGLYSAMCKYSLFYKRKEHLYTYRCDRIVSLDFLKIGRTVSFTSTSRNRKGTEEFQKKKGILLLEFDLLQEEDIEYIDVNAVLGEDSKYPHEEEILFSPFLYFDRERLELTEEEKEYKDKDGNMPCDKYKILLRGTAIGSSSEQGDSQELEKLYCKIMNASEVENAKRIWESLESHKEPDSNSVESYEKWKENIQTYLKKRFSQIKGTLIGGDEIWKLEELRKELSDYKRATDEKRKEYKNYLGMANISVSILQPVAAFAVALSFVDNCEPWAQIVSLALNAVCMAIIGISRSMAWEGKLKQRTATFLRLDELERNIRYEMAWNKEKAEAYIEQFKMVIREDDALCEENVKSQIGHLQLMTKKEGEQK